MGKLPLEGLRIADFSWVWAGPYCTKLMADMGAEVIKIETAKRPDVTRMLPPWFPGPMPTSPNQSGYYNMLNRNKTSVTLDLTTAKGVEIAKKLVATSDVVVENFAADVMTKFGLNYDVLRRLKRDIVMISMPAYGSTGPDSHYISYGPAQVPLSGMSFLTGFKGGPPMHVGTSYGDPTAGLHACFAVMSALHYRKRTGHGQYIDLSQWETSIMVIPEGIMEYTMNGTQRPRMGNHDDKLAPHNIYRCEGDDDWVSIAVGTEEEWQALGKTMERPDLIADPRFSDQFSRWKNQDELDKIITEWTLKRDKWTAMNTLQAAGVAATITATNKDVVEDPNLNERGFMVEQDHPEVGKKKIFGLAWKMGKTPGAIRRPAPLQGQHTEYVLSEILKYSPEEIAQLKDEKVLF